MILRGGKVLIGKAFVESDIWILNGAICRVAPFACMQEVAAGEEILDVSGCTILPGLVDIHCHGAVGRDVSDAEGFPEFCAYELRQGVTTLLPATMTLPIPRLMGILGAVRQYLETEPDSILRGIHLEGPFLNGKRLGAQKQEYLSAPAKEALDALLEAGGGLIRLITIAPEEAGALDLLRTYAGRVNFSVGHTMADYETAREAFKAGANHVTHLYNAMPALHHRQPGVIPAAVEAGCFAELICDGLHVHPAMVRLAFSLFAERLVLISDSMRGTGMPDGIYELGGNRVEKKGRRATLEDGTLAGSVSSLYECMKQAVAFGIPLEQAAYAATAAPAISVGLEGECGVVAEGRKADLLLLRDNLEIDRVIKGGKVVQ